jgi:hypothetical protein
MLEEVIVSGNMRAEFISTFSRATPTSSKNTCTYKHNWG